MTNTCALVECKNPSLPHSPYCYEHATEEDRFQSKAISLLNKIRENKELCERELGGLVEGERRGKKPTVSIDTLFIALEKQFIDLKRDYDMFDPCWVGRAKKDLADIRNVAGILFLVLNGESSFVTGEIEKK